MTARTLLRLTLIVLLAFTATGCFNELGEIFNILLLEESDDPEVRKTGEALRTMREEREAQEAVARFLETGDRSHLDAARTLRPDDTSIRAYDVVVATLDGDPATIEAAQEALALAEARRRAKLSDDSDPPTTARQLRRNVLSEILVAQTHMLGGFLYKAWDPPGEDASPKTKQLFADYCSTRNEIQTQFNDPLDYIPLPPCPSA